MARNKGTFNFAANFEVLTKAPLDARLVVDTKSNLTDPTIWQDVDTNVWLYKGITVSVVSDPSTENNGLYFLTDELNYTNIDKWAKLGEGVAVDASGTSWQTFQLNNDENGVILKDASGNLEVVTFDGSTYAAVTAGHIEGSSLKIDALNGALYAQDGSVYAVTGTAGLLAFEGTITGNNITTVFPIIHDLSTLKQNVNVWHELTNEMVFPDIVRGSSTNTISFSDAPVGGENYKVNIMGWQ